MKSIFTFFILTTAVSCSIERELQAEMVEAKLIRIEETHRYPDIHRKILTWEITGPIMEKQRVTTYAPAGTDFPIGMLTKLLVSK